jgi:hypothetical protein
VNDAIILGPKNVFITNLPLVKDGMSTGLGFASIFWGLAFAGKSLSGILRFKYLVKNKKSKCE